MVSKEILWVYFTIPFGFSLFLALLDITFQLLKLSPFWLRITDEGSVPEMRIWSILLIKSDLRCTCIYFSRSLFLYWQSNEVRMLLSTPSLRRLPQEESLQSAPYLAEEKKKNKFIKILLRSGFKNQYHLIIIFFDRRDAFSEKKSSTCLGLTDQGTYYPFAPTSRNKQETPKACVAFGLSMSDNRDLEWLLFTNCQI